LDLESTFWFWECLNASKWRTYGWAWLIVEIDRPVRERKTRAIKWKGMTNENIQRCFAIPKRIKTHRVRK